MPPEPSPWDRKDFLRGGGEKNVGGSVARWRDSPRPTREFVQRWGSDDLRRTPSGYGKQGGGGGYHLFGEENLYGSTATPSRMLGDESSFRSRGGGRYNRGGAGWRSPWEAQGDGDGEATVSSSGRQILLQQQQEEDFSAKRSVSDLITYSSHPHSDSWDQPLDKMASVNGLSTGQRYDKEQSQQFQQYQPQTQPLAPMGWKSLKWTRSTSLSSRGSGFSHTSSSRSMGADSDEPKHDSQSGRATPSQSPSGDGGGNGSSPSPSEDTGPRKKPRLGWGQGLAKYEKAKVEGSDETVSKSGSAPCEKNTNSLECVVPSLADKSPRIIGLSECSSPATTSSVACSSSPGIDDKHHVKPANDDTYNLSSSPGRGLQSSLEEFNINLEHLELTSAANLHSFLGDLLQVDDSSSGDSNFVKSTAMNKLLLLKGEFSKALEKTECEIDSFENELKLLFPESERNGPCSVASDSLQLECGLKTHEEVGTASKVFQKPGSLQLASSSDMLVDTPILCTGVSNGDLVDVKNDEMDSPGTATSKFVEPLSIVKTFSRSSMGRPDRVEDRSGYLSGNANGNKQLDVGPRIHASGDPNQPNGEEYNLHDLIVASNRAFARKAYEEFSKLLPADQPQNDIWGLCSASCQKYNSLVKKKLAARKCYQRFKEKVLALKFRSLQHLWKEDLRLLSIRKYKAKSQKRIEFTSKSSSSVGSQKHRSSIRSRFTSPAGNLTLVPTTEIVDFTSKLLSGSQIMLQRNSLKMPSLILDEKEKRLSRFVSRNGLVEDPCAVEKERVAINPWTPKEKEIFLEMLATFGKDFKKISSFLDHKTIADCIEYYYKNHKSESFQKMKKKSDPTKQERSFTTSTYLVTSGKKWHRDVNAASLEILGAASVIASHADENMKSRQATVTKSSFGGHRDYKTFSCDDFSYEKSSSADALGNEREATAADTLAGISGAVSSEAMSSCVTSSVDPGEGCQEWKLQRRSDRPLTPSVMQVIDDEETCSDESFDELDNLDWTDEEKSNFIGALRSYGKDFLKISRCVGTRSTTQCKVFFSKSLRLLNLDMMHLGSGNEGTPVSDANGGRSDTDDACVLELESAICSTQSCSKMDGDMPLSSIDTNCETLENAGTDCLQTEADRSEENNEKEQSDHDNVETAMEESVVHDSQPGIKPDSVSCDEDVVFRGEYNATTGSTQPADSVSCDEDVVFRGEYNATTGSTQLADDGNTYTDNGNTDTELVCALPVLVQGSGDLTAELEALEQQKTDQMLGPSEESPCSQGTHLLVQSMSVDAVENEAVPGTSADVLMTESEKQRCLVDKNRYDSSQSVKNCVDATSSSSGCFDHNFASTLNQASEASVNPSICRAPKLQPETPLELLSSVQKTQTPSWKQKENCPAASANLDLQDSVIHFKDRLQRASSSTTLSEEPGNEQHQRPISSDEYQQYLSCHNSLNRVDSSQILRGYPLQVLNKKDLHGHDTVISESNSIFQNFSKVNRNFQSGQFVVENFTHEKCSDSKLALSAQLQFLSQNHEQPPCFRSRSHSQGSSDTDENSRKSGDFKLFGQILHPSSTLASTNEMDKRGKSGSKIDLKLAADHGTGRGLMTSKLDSSNNYISSEDFPMRSYGFWDGQRIQTGLSSLPDSAMLLAKYPGAFNEYPAVSSCGEQQSLPAVIKRNDRNLGSLSVYPSKDGSLPDYQYRGYDGVKAQPFTLDVKRHDTFCELQKRNGLDVSSFQQQARGAVGMNGMGAGILLGGGCTGVSDPVAAIKMHYATTGHYGGHGGCLREEDSWREDIGR